MLERHRQHELMRQRRAASGESVQSPGHTPHDNYYDAVDNAIANAMSADSEAFNQQIEQPNGQ